ncbi:Nup160 domain-containing protein [Cephalotus follicularis]|uniref:Nup160 domain-containing protein n=1 Tax=Cephalotus follicularis TaxID=3775 RepID=A0A1Q3D1R8_CEPFO|nr:Nup160 domain-containing protein [Cephalotus follicularis]
MGNNSKGLAGMEVPMIGTDSISIKWIHIKIPSSSSSSSSSSHDSSTNNTRLEQDCGGSFLVNPNNGQQQQQQEEDPSSYFIWRIYSDSPNTLHLLHLSPSSSPSPIGLRLSFPSPLSPFAFICTHNGGNHLYSLYALTVSGVAYFLKLKTLSAYSSSSVGVFLREDFVDFDLHSLSNHIPEPITSAAAYPGRLLLATNDGSVSCYKISPPGFSYELRDDAGIARLWGFMSRIVAPVQDMVISEIQGRKLLLVLHSDGVLRVWDLLSRTKIFGHTLTSSALEGATPLRLWVGEGIRNANTFPLAILYRRTLESSMEMVYVYNLSCTSADKITLSLESSMQNIPLEEGGCIDVKITSDKIWILKDNGLVYYNLSHPNVIVEEARYYALQEEFVAEQLFQSSEHSFEDLFLITHSILSSAKDHITPFISSIFLRRLLDPGVHHNNVLRATFLDYNKHWTDSEYQSLTVDELRKEILSIIENEGVTEGHMSVLYHWRNFCARYFHYWCKNNAPYGLLVDSSRGAVGLIRKNSVSLFRGLENIELLVDGSDESSDFVSSGEVLFGDDFEREVLFEVLRCVISINQQLGKTISAIFYESLIRTPVISFEEIVPRLLKILETGYSSSVAALHMFGTEELTDHKYLRKFSFGMLLSLHALCKKAGSWGKVLNIIERYLQFFVPRKIQKMASESLFNININIVVQATSQISKVMYESALDVLLFVTYLVNISGQIYMMHDDISKIQLELVPMIQETVYEWLIIHFLGTTPSELPTIEDFSSQLSSLQIDSNIDKRSWNEKLGRCDFTLAFIILLNSHSSSGGPGHLPLKCLPNPQDVISSVRDFISWIIWGKSGDESFASMRRTTELALILFRQGQHDSVEYLLTIVEANSRKEKICRSIQDAGGDWCVLQHLLGCCLLAQAQCKSHGMLKERKVCEAVRCFFRASSGEGASQALQSLSHEAGLLHFGFKDFLSSATWKLHYYQWAMQIFEQYNISEGACQFALAALEQVDEALSMKNDISGREPLNESANTVKGRIWANVFKFTLDLNLLYDAYCAIISNPDEESKYICLRRFIIVLYERGAMKILCDGQLPFIGLSEKVERELAWKAERSDILAKPNPYKLLYAFEMHRHNWQRAASYIYTYSVRLRTETVLKDNQHVSLVLQESLNGLSAALNALQLVHPAYAWIDPLLEGSSLQNEHYPSKKAKKTMKEQSTGNEVQPQRLQTYIGIEELENEFVLISAEYWLSLANVKWTYTGSENGPSDLVDLLVQTNLYDMAFTVALKFWKDSRLKRELEKVFSAISMKCCPNKVGTSWVGNDLRAQSFLLASSKDEVIMHGSPEINPANQPRGNSQWETLELYLEKYKGFHDRLPVIVAETLLCADPQIELPLWLVNMFKVIFHLTCHVLHDLL